MNKKSFQDDFVSFLKNSRTENNIKNLQAWFPEYSEESLKNRAEIYAQSIAETHQKTLRKIFRPFLVLLGKNVSQQLFERYAEQYFSNHFDLNLYGKDFSRFIQDSAPWVKDYPYVPDFADFCWNWHQVFLNKDLPSAEFAELTEMLKIKKFEKIILKTAEALVLIKSQFPVYEIWKCCQPEYNPQESGLPESENLENFYILYRHTQKVRVVSISSMDWETLNFLKSGG